MTECISRRLFLGGLFDGVTANELKARFEKFGVVDTVDIKVKKNDEGQIQRTFAYINITSDEKKLKQCMSVYNKTKWKGQELTIQTAKENFMTRLKQEQKNRTETESAPVKDEVPTPSVPTEETRNWVVGKNGQLMPVVYIRRKDKKKVMKYDPLKYEKGHKSLEKKSRNENDAKTVSELTWSIDDKETKMTKKRKGIFDSYSVEKKPAPSAEAIEYKRLLEAPDDLEVVRTTGRKVNNSTKRKYFSESDDDSDNSAGSADTDEIIAVNKRSKIEGNSSSGSLDTKKQIEKSNVAVAVCKNDVHARKETIIKSNSSKTDLPSGANGKKQSVTSKTKNIESFNIHNEHELDSMNIHDDSDSADSADTDELITKSRRKISEKSGENCLESCDMVKQAEDDDDDDDDADADDDDIFDIIKSGKIKTLEAKIKDKVDKNSTKLSKHAIEISEKPKKQEGKSKHDANSESKCPQKHNEDDMEEKKTQTIKASSSVEKPSKEKASKKDKKAEQKKKKEKCDLKKERKVQSEQKRQQSLNEKVQHAKNQKIAIKQALSNVDKIGANKKVVFDSDEEEEQFASASAKVIASSEQQSDDEQQNGLIDEDETAKAIKLFDSESEESEEEEVDDFRIRPEYQGKKGQKLLEIQNKYSNRDDRFKMDKRFVQSDSDEDSSDEQSNDEGATTEAERMKNLSILRDVLGVQSLTTQPRKMFKDMNAFHYDPDNPEHKQFEIQQPDAKGEPTSQVLAKADKVKTKEPQNEETLPEVSKERFFQVEGNIKESFQKSSEGFSLLSLFGKNEEVEKPQEQSDTTPADSGLPWQQQQQFDDESSDNEDYAGAVVEPAVQPFVSKPSTFFFAKDDAHIAESVAFFHASKNTEEVYAQWAERRPELVELYRMRRKQALRKKRNIVKNKVRGQHMGQRKM